jgi:IS30 family transposase
MKKYKQLTHKERYQIYALIKEGFNYSQIAKNIGVNKSTISREIKRNSKSKNTYHPDSASIEVFARGLIVNRVSISKRPKIVDKKIRIGDWEVDTIIGKYHQGAIVTIVDRKSKFTLMRILPTKEAIGVSNAIIELLYPVRQFTHTITSDNGKEFTLHENISKSLNTDFYFCDPYSSWQRGLNENTNGLIRRYIPKRTEFENISKNEIMMIQNCLNHRPRKALGYKTPFEVFMNEISRKMVA